MQVNVPEISKEKKNLNLHFKRKNFTINLPNINDKEYAWIGSPGRKSQSHIRGDNQIDFRLQHSHVIPKSPVGKKPPKNLIPC